MKIFTGIFLIFLFSSIGSAQKSPSDNITDKQITDLSQVKINLRPKVSMQKAFEIMENYVKVQKIDTSGYFLHQVKLIQYGSENNKRPVWHFGWMNESGSLGNYIEIIVEMNETAWQSPSM